jgi:hypothetical protein
MARPWPVAALLLEAEQEWATQFSCRYATEITQPCRTYRRLRAGQLVLLTGVSGADALIGQNQQRPAFDISATYEFAGFVKHDHTTFPWHGPYLRLIRSVEKWKAVVGAAV